MRQGLRGTLAIWLALCACARTGGPSAPAVEPAIEAANVRPNIILITAEDLSPRLGAYGDGLARTPNIDGLAKEGIRFTNVFTASPVCAPSRSALITGVHPQTLGTMHMRTSSFGENMDHGAPYEAVPPAQVKAFPELLRAAGYYTVNRAKTDYQFGEPFTIWDAHSEKADWSGRASGQPFFAMINYFETHESRTWPLDTRGSHPAIPKMLESNRQLDAAKLFPLTDPALVDVPPYYPDTAKVRANLARHYDNIRVMDQKVGALLDQLRRAGRFEDSIIIYTTDHGDGLPRSKRALYDTGLRVPLIVRYPDGRGAGTTRDELVSFVDLAPTILALAETDVPDWIQGRDILGSHRQRDHVYATADRFDEVIERRKLVRDNRYAYIRNFITDQAALPFHLYQNINPITAEWRRLDAEGKLTPLQRSYLHGPIPAEELYDTETDPHQIRNLATDPAHRGRVLAMRAAMEAWIARTGDLSATPELELVARIWPDGKQPKTAVPTACGIGAAVRLASATPGASIGWRGEDGAWRLYAGPVKGAREAKAIRYGYAESAVARLGTPSSLPVCTLAAATIGPNVVGE